MTEQEVLDAVTEKLTGNKFIVGQRVRIIEKFGEPTAGCKGYIEEVVNRAYMKVKLDHETVSCTWSIGWLEPIQPNEEQK